MMCGQYHCQADCSQADRMRKFPKTRNYRSMLGTGIKVALVLEGLALAGTYALWRQMNVSRGEIL